MKNRKVLIYIPAKKNSCRLARKNLRVLNKKKLFEHTLDFALVLKKHIKIKNNWDVVIVFDSNIKLPQKYEGKVVWHNREKRYAQANVAIAQCFSRAMMNLGLNEEFGWNDIVVILQPTTPFRDLRNVYQAVMSVDKNNPFLASTVEVKNPILKGDDVFGKGVCKMESGSFFIFFYGLHYFIHSFSGFKIVAKPFEDKMFLQDIDTIEDFDKVKQKIKEEF